MLLYLGLTTKSDSAYRYYANPLSIKGYIFPHCETMTPAVIQEALLILWRKRYLCFYRPQGDGRDFLVVEKHRPRVKCTADPEHPEPPPGYYTAGYNPFEPTLPFEQDKQEQPPKPKPKPDRPASRTAAVNCCLSNNSLYGLQDSEFADVVLPWCASRQRNQWCNTQAECHGTILTVIQRIKTLSKEPIANYPRYLSTALQKHLVENADTLKRSRPRKRTGTDTEPEGIAGLVPTKEADNG